MTLVRAIKIILFSKDDDDVEHSLQTFFCKMFIIGRAICFVLAVVFTVIAVITNSQSSNRRVPPVKPFFTRETWVEDFYEGELYYALLKGNKYDSIFMMLYAPWDADSQNARIEFETTCRYYHKKIYCAAVNCWQANADCKAFYDNIPVYPVFLVDLYNLPTVKYNGEYVASHMIRFLSTVLKPFERINSMEEFQLMRASCDALLIAHFPTLKWYNRYYAASLKFLEFDPRRDVCWSIVTDASIARKLHINSLSARMYTWNETKDYSGTFGSKDFIKWVYENTKLSTRWLSFKNARSSLLSDLVVHNTAVILFTPRNMFLENIPSYLIFKEVSLEFRKCITNTTLPNGQTFFEYRHMLRKNYDHWQHICTKRFQIKNEAYSSSILQIDSVGQVNKKFFQPVNSEQYLCKTNIINRTNSTLDSKIRTRTSMLHQNEDERSPRNLVFQHVREKCRQFNLLKRTFTYSYFSNKPEKFHLPTSLNTLSCRLNHTVNFFAVDSLLYSHFATSLGINLDHYDDRTTVAIFNNRNEETFVLNEKFDKNSLIELLTNFTDSTLRRWTKSTANATIYLNRYNKLNNRITDEMAIVELNSDTFDSFVFNSSQHVIVYYYSPYCSYCQVSAHVFLTVANMLKNITNIVFARVDGENNDLIWYLVPQIYPTVIFFPAKKKSESIVFPQSLEITTENLFEFVLSNVGAEIKLKVMIDKCNNYRNLEHETASLMFHKCITNVKTYCIQLIDNLIVKYKKTVQYDSSNDNTVTHLQNMLDRLKYLKSVYFSLGGT